MVEDGKRKRSHPSSSCVSLPTSKTHKQNIDNTKVKNNGHNEIKKFKKSLDVEKPVDLYESLYNDPITEDMGAHEKFVFNLGLDLALEYTLDSFDSMIKDKQEEMNLCNVESKSNSQLDSAIVNSLPFNIEKKHEFFNDLNNKRSIVRKRTKSFHFPLKECIMCNFKTESNLVLDSHLSEPHNMSTLRCNYCYFETEKSKQFNTTRKDEFKKHMLEVHSRTCKLERAFTTNMCNICDYECNPNSYKNLTEARERINKHINLTCPFFVSNLNEHKIYILENMSVPTQIEYLQYIFMFNRKPLSDDAKNKKYIENHYLFQTSLQSSPTVYQYELISIRIMKQLIIESLNLTNEEVNTLRNEFLEFSPAQKSILLNKPIQQFAPSNTPSQQSIPLSSQPLPKFPQVPHQFQNSAGMPRPLIQPPQSSFISKIIPPSNFPSNVKCLVPLPHHSNSWKRKLEKLNMGYEIDQSTHTFVPRQHEPVPLPSFCKTNVIAKKQNETISKYEQRLKKSPSPEIICLGEESDEEEEEPKTIKTFNTNFNVPNKTFSTQLTNNVRVVPTSSPQMPTQRLECEFCLVKFNGGLILSSLMNHLKQYHSITNPRELSEIIKRALLKNQQSFTNT